MADPTPQGPGAPATVVARGAADASAITTRDDDQDVMTWRAGDVVVDLAQAEPADVGTAVDLAQPDSIYDGGRSRAAGPSPPRVARAGRLLSPSWPSAIRLTNAFGTTDLIDAREEPRG